MDRTNRCLREESIVVDRRSRSPLVALAATLIGVALAGCAGGFAPQGPPGATDIGALGCQVAQVPGTLVREGDPLAPGEPMAGVDVTRMTPRQVGELARSRGLKVTWRYEYGISGGAGPGGPPLAGATPNVVPDAGATPGADEGTAATPPVTNETSPAAIPPAKPGGVVAGPDAMGFSECWCEPPPDGRVTGVAYGMASELVVFVSSDRTMSTPREQPPRGWGC